jgi:hypothetical protein
MMRRKDNMISLLKIFQRFKIKPLYMWRCR